jgi:hypothetical protein
LILTARSTGSGGARHLEVCRGELSGANQEVNSEVNHRRIQPRGNRDFAARSGTRLMSLDDESFNIH